MPADVFISYSHDDKNWVRNVLLPNLKARGISTLIDFEDFQGGAFAVEQMQEAVENTRKTLIVMTPSYMKSEWSKLENVMVQTLDPAAKSRKLIPLLKVRCKIPLRIKVMLYRDFTDPLNEPWDDLYNDLL